MVKDLTEGSPEEDLRKLTIPMFVSVIFQQLNNIADSMIAGRFAGENALAAVGASYPATMIFMAIAVGGNIGCSVVISSLYQGLKRKFDAERLSGAGRWESLWKNSRNTFAGFIANGVIICCLL